MSDAHEASPCPFGKAIWHPARAYARLRRRRRVIQAASDPRYAKVVDVAGTRHLLSKVTATMRRNGPRFLGLKGPLRNGGGT